MSITACCHMEMRRLSGTNLFRNMGSERFSKKISSQLKIEPDGVINSLTQVLTSLISCKTHDFYQQNSFLNLSWVDLVGCRPIDHTVREQALLNAAPLMAHVASR